MTTNDNDLEGSGMDWLAEGVEDETDGFGWADNVGDGDASFDWAVSSDNKGKGKRKPPKYPPYWDTAVIALDAEYTLSDCGTFNIIDSVQFELSYRGKTCERFIEVEDGSPEHRPEFDQFLVEAIEYAIEQGVLTGWPVILFLCGHFIVADLFAFKNARAELKDSLKALRKTVLTMGENYGVQPSKILNERLDKHPFRVWDKSRNDHYVKVRIIDTMLFAPNGKSLADVGRLLGMPKLTIPAPYSISNFAEYLEGDPEGAREYALQDARISGAHLRSTIQLCKQLGLKGLPFSISGLAMQLLKQELGADMQALFGCRVVKREIWPKGKTKPVTVKKTVPTEERDVLESFATRCYHGGRNESFLVGPTEIGMWNDLDAPSCYTSAVNDLRPLHYEAMYMSSDLDDFRGDIFGLAKVEFEFPDTVRFPTLPVRADSFGLIFPLRGISHCTAPEIELSLRLGAKIRIIQGFIIPWASECRIFPPFMKWIRDQRLLHTKGSFNELMFKECGNSVYGKLGQGLRNKTAFDIAVGFNKPIPPSPITNPMYAAHTTGVSRALMGEMINAVPENRTVVSVTTDGFLTDANIEEIDLSGPTCERFRALFHMIDDKKGEILELKHQASQIFAIKTRGQVTSIKSEKHEPVLAKCGIKLPPGVEDENEAMGDLIMGRFPGQELTTTNLTSLRKMFLYDRDLIPEDHSSRLNLEPDWKRDYYSPVSRKVFGGEHLACVSRPFNSVEDMMFVRLRFDNWRATNCLKSLVDWNCWQERLAMYRASNDKGVRIAKNETSADLFKRLFIRVYAQEKLGLKRPEPQLKELAEWLTECGYETKPESVRSAKRLKLILAAVPVTPNVITLLRLVLKKYPKFQYEAMFRDEDLGCLRRELSAVGGRS